MTDYKNLKLIATSNPHIRSSETTRSIMLDVVIAMVPALIWAIVTFGMKALTLKFKRALCRSIDCITQKRMI